MTSLVVHGVISLVSSAMGVMYIHLKNIITSKLKKKIIKTWAAEALALLYPVMGVKGFSILRSCLVLMLHLDAFLMFLMVSVLESNDSSTLFGSVLQIVKKVGTLATLKRSKKSTEYCEILNLHRTSEDFLDLKSRVMWKATEWRNMLLFYGPFIFKGIIKTKYYKHFLLF